MSVNPKYEVDRALAIVQAVSRVTPEDAARDLIDVLSHVTTTMVEGTYSQHEQLGCAVCIRARTWLPILNGFQS